MTEPLDQPLRVVAGDELPDDHPRLLQILEPVEVQTLLLECPHEALGDAVALWLADVRGADRNAQPLHLVNPGIGDVLGTPALCVRMTETIPPPEITALPGFVWVEIEASAVEEDGRLEVLGVAEAARRLLHPLDDRVDALEAALVTRCRKYVRRLGRCRWMSLATAAIGLSRLWVARQN